MRCREESARRTRSDANETRERARESEDVLTQSEKKDNNIYSCVHTAREERVTAFVFRAPPFQPLISNMMTSLINHLYTVLLHLIKAVIYGSTILEKKNVLILIIIFKKNDLFISSPLVQQASATCTAGCGSEKVKVSVLPQIRSASAHP